jgi:hypothetical protein
MPGYAANRFATLAQTSTPSRADRSLTKKVKNRTLALVKKAVKAISKTAITDLK